MKIHRDTLADATDEQLFALRSVLREWKHVPDSGIHIHKEVLGPAIMVDLKSKDQDVAFTVGIEKDGYAHS